MAAAAQRKFEIVWLGDSKDFERSLKNVGDGLDKSSSRFKKFGKAAAVGVGAGLAAAGAAMKSFADKAIESEKSQAALEAQMKAMGLSYKDHADEIDTVIKKTSKLAGLDDEELADAFTNVVRVSGDVNKSLKQMGLVADFARAKQLDAAKAAEIIGKVMGGNTGILSRYGITLKEGATAQEALGELQRRFAGQAEAYGNTTAGAQDKFRVAVENLQESLGAKLLPIIAKVAEALVGFIEGIENGTGAGGKMIAWVKEAVENIVAFAKGFDDALGITEHVIPAIVDLVKGIATAVRGVVDVIKGIINGDFSLVWDGMKAIVQGAWDAVTAIIGLAIQGIIGLIKGIAGGIADIGGNIFQGVSGAFADAAGWIADKIAAIIGWIAGIPGKIAGIGVNIFQGVAGAFDAVKDWIGNKIEAILGWIIGIPGKIAAIGSNLFQGISGAFEDVKGWIGDKINTLLDWIGNIPASIAKFAGKLFKPVKDAWLEVKKWIWGQKIGAQDLVISDEVRKVFRDLGMKIVVAPKHLQDYGGNAQGGTVPWGGMSRINELGPELLTATPAGVRVTQASETAAMAGPSGPAVHIEHYHAERDGDAQVFARTLAWRLATG